MEKSDQEAFSLNQAALSEDVYHQMINEVKDYAIIILDARGTVLDWNQGAEKIKGYTPKEILGKSFSVFYPEADVISGLPLQLLAQAKKDGSAIHEGWRVKKDGTKFWGYVVLTAIHNSTGDHIGFAKVTRDLTERKLSEDRFRSYAAELEVKNEELRQSEERYSRMIAEVEDYAIILLDKDGQILDWNAGAQAIKGYSAKEIVGSNFRIFYTPDDRNQKLPEMLIDLAVRKGKAQHEGWRVRKDGTKFWGSITITALHDPQNNIIGFSKVTRDLTDIKLAQDNLVKKNSELEEANRELAAMNNELSSFAYISSHDLQEPLRKIQTFSTRIVEIDKDKLSEKGTNYFNRIQAASQRMRLLIEDLLTYSRANSADRKFTSISLNEIVKEVLNDLETTIEERHAKIEVGELPTMAVVKFQFHQLLTNLINNSLKFAKPNEKTSIAINSKIIAGERIIEIDKKLTGSFHHLIVADNGIGFNQEHSSRIFEVFQRLHGKDEYTGTGVGLAICKKIVENHFGYIRAEGKVNGGATIHMYFPMA